MSAPHKPSSGETPPPLVKINTDSAEQIAQLYGIGDVLAARIVTYRDANGPFHSPDDLSKVEGIQPQLAYTLSPHIDWNVSNQPHPFKSRFWVGSLIYLILIGVGFFFLIDLFAKIQRNWSDYVSGASDGWLWLLIQFLGFFAMLFITMGLLFRALGEITTSRRRDQIFQRLWVVSSALVVVLVILMGIALWIWYQFYALLEWGSSIDLPHLLVGIFGLLFICFFNGPYIIVLLNPRLRTARWLTRLVDLAILIGAPLSAILFWLNREDLPLPILILYGFYGIFFAYLGYRVFRHGESFFNSSRWLDAETLSRNTTARDLMRRFNIQFPDPDEQKQLAAELAQKYPPSRLRTIGGIIVFGAGVWIILAALSGAIQWLVSRYLDLFFPK